MFPCPKCGGKTKHVKTKKHSDGVLRRRECVECEHRFSTKEKLYDVDEKYHKDSKLKKEKE